MKSVIFRLVKISGLFWLNSVVFNTFVDLGGDYYQKRNEREEKRKLVAKIRKLGLSQEELAALLK